VVYVSLLLVVSVSMTVVIAASLDSCSLIKPSLDVAPDGEIIVHEINEKIIVKIVTAAKKRKSFISIIFPLACIFIILLS
jgi:hypothetical protein